MAISRRGLIGLFGKAALAAPFAGTVLALEQDNATGLLIPPDKVPLVDLAASPRSAEYLSIPVSAIRSVSTEISSSAIDVTTFDSSVRGYVHHYGVMLCRLDFFCDAELARHVMGALR